MPRLARKNLNTPFLHMMVQGVNKEFIFNETNDIEYYLTNIQQKQKEYDYTILAYCVMNNHAHFLIYTKDISKFGIAMHKLNLMYAKKYNKEKQRCGVLFRNRYHTEPIFDIKYLINCIKYIHENPVRANMVHKCEDYKYSSYWDYVNNIGATQFEIMKELFGNKCDYKELFADTNTKKFLDIEDSINNEDNFFIKTGIKEFQKLYNTKITEPILDRQILKQVINFLHVNWNIPYTKIGNYFGITRNAMKNLKI